MSADAKRDVRSRWLFAAVGAAGLIGVGAVLFHGPSVSTMRPIAMETNVARTKPLELRQVDDGASGLNEEALLFDPTPLFLPTKWNAAQSAVPRRELSGAFDLIPAELRLKESGLALQLIETLSGSEIRERARSAEAAEASVGAFGRVDLPAAELVKRDALVEVFAAGTGQKVYARTVVDAGLSGETLWTPLECMVSVGETGLVGSVAITQRSGLEVVDSEFQRYITQTLKVGERLAPGFYRIWVGP